MMLTLYLFFRNCWREFDAWLYDRFEFGLFELAWAAQDFLIEVTR